MKNKSLFLKSLSLNNFATFKDSFIEFDQGFNVIAGETGSGKSLILDALCLILGQRADKKVIRKGNDFLIIEAVFQSTDPEISKFFDLHGFPMDEDEIVLKRIVYSTGKSKNFINYQQCNLNSLVSFSKRFIDIVGQFENQKLLSENYQLVLLDRFAGLEKSLEVYNSEYENFKQICSQIESLKTQKDNIDKELDYINFQLEELESLDPSIDDEIELNKKKSYVIDFEKRQSLYSTLSSLLDDENGINNAFSIFQKKINQNISLVDQINIDDVELVAEKLSIFSSVLSANDEYDFSDDDFDNIMERLDRYQKLKSKHKTDTEGLLSLIKELSTRKKELINFDVNLSELEKSKIVLFKNLSKQADNLHEQRMKASEKLSKLITSAISNLNMTGATVSIKINKTTELGRFGFNTIKIMVETNKGEGYYDLKSVASGGELSRILLAFRQVLSSKDSISIFLFDEIDTGVGGETALKIGNSLYEVSNSSQVVAITHLPQITSYATKVLNVAKSYDEEEDRTFSFVTEISGIKDIRAYTKSMTPLSQSIQ